MAKGPPKTLTARALNRALLSRQFLLERSTASALEMIEHLVGMQTQSPLAPYVGLWSRVSGFGPADLSELISGRKAVRTSLLRTTLHLVTARDCLRLRTLVQPVLERGLYSGSPFGRQLGGVEIAELLSVGRQLVEEQPRSTATLAKALSTRWPHHDSTSLAQAVRYLVPMVQLPPRGIWGAGGLATWTTVDAWLGPMKQKPTTSEQLVLRYLAAFGPASARDVQDWSWIRGWREVLERLRPRLRVFRDEEGIELFDLPRGALPDPDLPVPPRFLPEYDNVVHSHADRTRIVSTRHTAMLYTRGTFLVDGFVQGTWRVVRERRSLRLRIDPVSRLAKADRNELTEEGMALLKFSSPDATSHDVDLGRPK